LRVPNLSHWDKPLNTTCSSASGTSRLGQAVLVPVGQVVLVPNLSHSDWERSKETCHIPTLEACPCCRTSPMTTMEPVPVQLVPTCRTKWHYKAVKSSTVLGSKNPRNFRNPEISWGLQVGVSLFMLVFRKEPFKSSQQYRTEEVSTNQAGFEYFFRKLTCQLKKLTCQHKKLTCQHKKLTCQLKIVSIF